MRQCAGTCRSREAREAVAAAPQAQNGEEAPRDLLAVA
jgi:hypothetical protein